MRAAWNRIWFTPRSGLDLAVTRLIVFWVAAAYLWHQFDSGYAATLSGLRTAWDPVSLVDLLNLPQPSSEVGATLWPVAIVLCVLAGLGTGGRWSAVPAGLLSTYLLMVGNSFGKINHGMNVIVMGLLVLVFSPAVASVVTRLKGVEDEARSWRYGWPVVAVRMGYALMFLAAGVSKLERSGLEWVFSENMRNILVSQNVLLKPSEFPEVALWLASVPILWQGMAAMTIVGETGLVLSMISTRRWLRYLMAVVAAGLQAGLNLLLRLGGYSLMTMVLVFTDWEWMTQKNRTTRLLIPLLFLGVAAVNYLARPRLSVALPTVAMGAVVTALVWSHSSRTEDRVQTMQAVRS